ncbi:MULTISPECIES: class I fructose-bisphosphate aldolase [unclassified Bradyrhizobium]
MSYAGIGLKRRLNRLFGPNGRTLMVALDATLISGNVPQPNIVAARIASSKPNAVLAYPGLLRDAAASLMGIPTIVNISASTEVGQHVKKVLVSSVENACRIGADAVCVHINIGNQYENDMIQMAGITQLACESIGMPLMIIAYPRREGADQDFNKERETDIAGYAKRVAHAARVAVDLGADIVKTQFTGSGQSFCSVLEACGSIPVLIAGGSHKESSDILTMAAEAIESGAAGICFGRNVFLRSEETEAMAALHSVVHGQVRTNLTCKHSVGG